eukprot:CAMPEP_0198370366 /NCGR_PEP_ID=MMETSP1450-20131203/156679_1 /TAXON_ID=753684 ORGANISM="Madagascaria erythrocladiodes, Strain CCMP3234" /NCGR_SAMPLE_ID=MMETSP1450 /ASSEMBLY_ACC=CAM_ASM_001115 /LENGTH=358 /DNA_ID=CAMNT_0044077907 /DNA_START=119 /DNA_END=1195 /DNA_ORIENTATION=+
MKRWNPFSDAAAFSSPFVDCSRGSSEDSEAALSRRLDPQALGERPDGADLSDDKLEALRQQLRSACERTGNGNYLDDYRPAHLDVLLTEFEPEPLARHMIKSHETFLKVRSIAKRQNPFRFEQLMKSGGLFVRGLDKDRRPIIWATETRLGCRFPDPESYVVLWSWTIGLAMKKRPIDVPLVTTVVVETGRPMLFFRLDSLYRLLMTCVDLWFPHSTAEKIYIVSLGSKSRATQIIFDTMKRVLPQHFADKLEWIETLDHLRSIVDHPSSIPNWVDRNLGSPFEVTEDTVGQYEHCLLGREEWTYKDVFNPPVPEEASETRQYGSVGSLEGRRLESGSAGSSDLFSGPPLLIEGESLM